MIKKKLGRVGKDRPTGIKLRRKSPNPSPALTLGTITPENCLGHTRSSGRPGPALNQCFGTRDRREDFFNHNLKFAPTGIRTQSLWSAARVS